jgi:hypothetical protein
VRGGVRVSPALIVAVIYLASLSGFF